MRKLLVIIWWCLIPSVVLAQCSNLQGPLASSYCPSITTTCSSYPSSLWVTGPLSKVFQNTGSAGTCTNGGTNTYAGNKWGTFYGTQNSFIDFQVHYHDSGSGTTGLMMVPSAFVQSSPSSFTISAATSSLPFNVLNYREGYMDVTTPSSSTLASSPTGVGNWICSAGPCYIPDPLIPAVDPYYGQTTNAWPFTVAASKNQSAWFEIHIPTTAPSGYYSGTITVYTGCTGTYPATTGCTTLATIPIILGVWQWPSVGFMPSTSTLQSYQTTGYSDFCIQTGGGSATAGCYTPTQYPGNGGDTSGGTGSGYAIADYGSFMLDHRMSAANPMYPNGNYTSTSFTALNTVYGPLLNGTTGHVQTILPGAKLTTSQYYTAGNSNAYISNWVTYYQSQGWLATLFNYAADEPNPPGGGPSWSTVISTGTTIHTNGSDLMPALVTTNIDNATSESALNAIDWMVTIINDMDACTVGASCGSNTGGPGTYLRPAYNTWLTGSCCGVGTPTRKVWSYLDCESAACGGVCYPLGNCAYNSNWPNWEVDGSAISNRAMEWTSFRNNVSGELYFGTTICWSPYCGGSDPWVSVDYGGVWGDGTLVYPGRQTGSPVGTGGSGIVGTATPIWIPSLRLKQIRDGYQDYEIMNVLTNKGQGTAVTNAIASWMTNSSTFNGTYAATGTFTSDLPDVIQLLGNDMHALSFGASAPPSAIMGGTTVKGSSVIH